MSKGKVAVIGGGIIGLCSAYYLRRKGYDVTIFEKDRLGDGCSWGNAGMIVPSHFIPLAQPGMISRGVKWMFNSESPFYIKPRLSWGLIDWGIKFYRSSTKNHVENSIRLLADLNLFSKSLYADLIKELGEFGLQKKGLIMLCKTRKGLEEEAELAKYAHRLDMKAEVMDKSQLAKLDPGINMDVEGGVYFPEDAFFTPNEFMKLLYNKVKELGVEIKEETEVHSFVINGNQIVAVKTNEHEIGADQFVIAGGSWSAGLARSIKVRIPLLAGKGYSFTISNPVQTPEICSILTEAKVAVTPMLSGLRFAGTMEIGSLDNFVNTKRVNGIKKSIPKYFPEFKEEDFEGLKIWYGFRPVSPDGLPYLGRPKAYSNMVIATGHGMMGMSMGPATGMLVSDIIDGAKPSVIIDQLDIDRF